MKAADIVWVFVCLLSIGSCEWNVKTDKCNNISPSILLELQDCTASMDNNNYLHANCYMYCFIDSTKISALVVSWGLRSLNPVTSFNDSICLWMTNVTIEKVVNSGISRMIRTQFYLESGWDLVLIAFEEGYWEIVFHQLGRMVGIANIQKLCNSSDGFSLAYDESSACKLSIVAISPMILSGVWAIRVNASLLNIYENIHRFSEVYLIKEASVSLFRVKLNNFIIDQKIFIQVLQRFNISRFEFCETKFREITNKDFQGFFNTRLVNLTEGIIETIAPNAFRDLNNLEILDLSYNRLAAIPAAIFVDSLKKLAYLNMEGNSPQRNRFTLKSNRNRRSPLLTLRLSRISIEKLSDNAFSPFPLLKKLYLDRCGLTLISNSAFSNLTFLVALDMTSNNIHFLPEDVFLPLQSLEYLSLNQNKLTRFTNTLADSLPNLSSLNLENNQLTELFNISLNLSVLNLRGNYIKSWESFNISHLRRLDLSSNSISVLKEKSTSALENIEEVDLSMNPYDCAPCPLYHLQLWLKRPNAQNRDRYTCNSPFNLAGEVALRLPSTEDSCFVRKANVVLIGIISFVCVSAFLGILIGTGYYFRLYLRFFVFVLTSRKSNETTPVYDAFVSYAKSERLWVKNELVKNLESAESGFRLCIHDRDFLAGDAITKNIIECIDQSRKVLLILSQTYVESHWCTLEAHLAQHRLFEQKKDSLIIVKIGHIPSKSLKRYFSYLIKTRTCLEWPSTEEPKEPFWNKLEHYLSEEEVNGNLPCI